MADTPIKINVTDDCDIAVRVDDFSLPWDQRAPVLMLHGLAESGEAFRRWVPALAGHHKVVRPDLRGYGDSTPMKPEYEYRFSRLGEDVIAVLDALKIPKAFVVGAKIGGTLAMHLAASYPDRVIAVAAVGAPASLRSFDQRAPGWRAQIHEQGVERWVRETTGGRLGSSLSPQAIDWWVELMSRTPATTLEAFLRMVPTVDVTAELPKITCPTLVITTTGSGLGDVETVKAWQSTIKGSRLEVVEADSYHVAATHPVECARLAYAFFDEVGRRED